MQNEFEKQVKQKMEELNVSPSAPVWQNIKKEISGKKERRRFLLWFFLAALVIGGGFYFGYNAISDNKGSLVVNKPNESKPPSKQTKDNNLSTNNEESLSEPNLPDVDEEVKRSSVEKLFQSTIAVARSMVTGMAITEESTAAMTNTAERKRSDVAASNKTQTKTGADQPLTDSVANGVTTIEPVRDSLLTEQVPDQTDSLNLLLPKFKKEKLIVGIYGGAGKSKIVAGFDLFEKSLADYGSSPGNNSGIPPANSLPPAEERAGLALTAGVSFKKQLSTHFSLVAGLEYNYFSTKIQTGQTVRQDTTLYLNSRQVRVESFYLNSAAPNQEYTNQFHFVGLPLMLNYTVSEKFPLNVSAGISVQQLLSTNALLFNYNGQFYYNDKDAFRKTQVFSSLGLSYSAGNLNIGPYLNYGLSKTLKDGNGNKHLFAAGLKAEFLLKK